MRGIYFLVLILSLAVSAIGEDRRPEDGWRIDRDEDGVVRIRKGDGKDAVRVPVARGGTPEGHLLFSRGDVWWLLIAYPDFILAGRAKTPEGPYLDHAGRSLLDGGRTVVAARLSTDPKRTLLGWTPGKGADRLETSDGVLPLVWPPHGFPVAGPVGTIDSWTRECREPWPFAGPWRHAVDAGRLSPVTMTADGKLLNHPAGTIWSVEDRRAVLMWPRRGAPGGAWIDRLLLSRDGRYYLGRNQWQAAIFGDVVTSEFRIQPTSRTLPVALLPKAAIGQEGKLSLWADFEHPRDGYVDLYVVNRTKETVKLPAQDGDIYAKLFSKTAAEEWERSQSHTYSWCGNSYFFEPEVPAGRFLVTHGYYPAKGEERPVRYRLMGEVGAVSNEGVGRVSPVIIEASRTDRMALRSADFTTLSEVALGEVKPLVRDRVDLRAYAVEQLAKRFPDDPRTEQIFRQLLSEPNRKVAEAARRALE